MGNINSTSNADAGEATPRQVCVITGGTSGIGLAAAVGIARAGHDVVLVGRDPERGARALAGVDAAVQRSAATFLSADLSSLASTSRLAEEILARWPVLRALVHCAGTIQQHRRENAEGIELTWALNVLAPAHLTSLLSEALLAHGRARIVLVSSRSHRWGRIHWDDPELHHGYNLLRAYSQSKLAEVLYAYELARHTDARHLSVVAAHPGLVRTAIARDVAFPGSLVWNLMARLGGRPVEEGAAPIVQIVSAEDARRWHGRYVGPRGVQRSSPCSYDRKAALRLWELIESQLGATRQAR